MRATVRHMNAITKPHDGQRGLYTVLLESGQRFVTARSWEGCRVGSGAVVDLTFDDAGEVVCIEPVGEPATAPISLPS